MSVGNYFFEFSYVHIIGEDLFEKKPKMHQ